MFKHRFVQILTICFQLCLLAVLFVPVMYDYGSSVTLWDKICQSYQSGNANDILTLSLYYIPVIITIVFMVVFEGRFRYVLAAMVSSMGLTITLIQFVFPAFASPYLFQIYQIGLYLLLSLQIITIILCIVGVSLNQCDADKPNQYIDTKSDTEEIIIEDIKSQIKKTKGTN